jgi:uncharacterized OB-fold protein
VSPLEVAALLSGDRDLPFWSGWADGERFLLHRCRVCGRHEWPATCCVKHGLAPMEWVESSARGTIDTFTVFRRAYSRELAADVPYVIAVLKLDAGPYFHTRLVGVSPELVKTGMRVVLRRGAGDAFPLFTPE